jgi:phosphotransferase system HPr-like phosphotransfer protein
MKEVTINLSTIDRVKNFVTSISRCAANADICSGNHYVVDAKSIMGIFSLDLSKPLSLRIYAEGNEADKTVEAIQEFVVA